MPDITERLDTIWRMLERVKEDIARSPDLKEIEHRIIQLRVTSLIRQGQALIECAVDLNETLVRLMNDEERARQNGVSEKASEQ